MILLGFVMGASYRAESLAACRRGRSEAQLIAQTAIEPLLGAAPLHARLRSGPVYDSLARVAKGAVGDHHVLRMRLPQPRGKRRVLR